MQLQGTTKSHGKKTTTFAKLQQVCPAVPDRQARSIYGLQVETVIVKAGEISMRFPRWLLWERLGSEEPGEMIQFDDPIFQMGGSTTN